jgi:hypothetical protein
LKLQGTGSCRHAVLSQLVSLCRVAAVPLSALGFLTVVCTTLAIPNASPQARSIEAADVIFQFRGQDTTAYLGRYLSCLGDINGDGFSDIALCSWSAVNAKTYVFYGGNPPDTIPDIILKGASGPPSAIDLDGDQIDEVITADEILLSPTESEEGAVYFYKGYSDSIASTPYYTMRPDTGNWAFGWDFRTGFVDADSLGDLLVLKYRRSPQQLLFFSGAPTLDTSTDWSFEISNPRQSFYSDFGFIDFNGDGHLDVFAAQTMRDPGFINVFLGPQFADTPDVKIDPPAEFSTWDKRQFGYGTFNVGDFDGDGWADLGVIFATRGLIYRCGPGMDTVYDYLLPVSCASMAAAGDVNGDGYNDLIAGGGYSEDGGVQIYLGGSKADTTYDMLITRAMLPPFFLQSIGYQVSSAGDFNGDGIDDFMFACENFSGGQPGAVFVIRGSADIVSSVDDRPGLLVPTQFELRQNYPNPFNVSTVIEFSLREKLTVTMELCNVVGQRVALPINQQTLSAGVHRITWNAIDDNGQSVASGVYFYRLSASGQVVVRKMILLK